MSVSQFSTTTELRTIGMSAPHARQVSVFFNEPNNDETPVAENYMGVYNEDAGRLSCIASKKYQIIQHRDVIDSLSGVLQDLNINVKGKVVFYNNGDEMRAELTFPDLTLTDNSDKGIQLGVRIINSYNLTNSLRGEFWGMRLVCSNGMKLPGWETAYRRNHLGNIDIGKGMREFIKAVADKKPALQALIDQNINNTIQYDQAVVIINKMFPGKKHKKVLLKRLEDDYQSGYTKYDLYNVVTHYATHEETLKRSAQDTINETARKMLEKPVEVLVR